MKTIAVMAATPATPLIRGGMPASIMSALANKVRSHPWVCIPHVFGTKKLTAITNVTKANPAVITSPGHNWENGEKVLIYRVSGMTQLNQNVYTVSQLRPEGRNVGARRGQQLELRHIHIVWVFGFTL